MAIHKTLNAYRRALKKFAYKAGTNVALCNAERSGHYKQFQGGIQRTLRKQIEHFINNPTYMEQVMLTVGKASISDAVVRIVANLWVGNEFDTRFNETQDYAKLDYYFKWGGLLGGQEALDKMGIDALFNLKNKEVLDILRDSKEIMVSSVDDTTRQYLAMRISEGREAFLTVDEIAKSITEELPDIVKSRAEVIALTETARAISTVQLETFKRNGIKEKEWVTSRDERVCEICGPLHGKTIKISGYFESGDFSEGAPPIHPRCRCDILEIIPDDFITNADYWIGG